MKYVYLLKIRQIYDRIWGDTDIVFQNTASAWIYLQDLWKYFETNYSDEEFECIPPVPTLTEIRNGLKNSNKYSILEIGFVNETDPVSLYITIEQMPIY